LNTINLVVYGEQSKKEHSVIYVSEKDFDASVFAKAQFTRPEIKKIQNSFLDKIPFLQLFDYDGVSMYWFFYPTFWAAFNSNLRFFSAFVKFIDEVQPKVIRVEDYTYFDIIKQICQKKNITFQYNRSDFLKHTLINKGRPFVRKYRLKKITKQKIKTRNDLYLTKYKSIHNMSEKIIFASSDVYRRYLINIDKKIIEKEEFFVYDLIRLLKDSSKSVGIALDYDIKGNIVKLKERLNSEVPWIPLESLLNNHNEEKNHNMFIRKYQKLIKSKQFRDLFEFDGVSIWKQLEPVFNQMMFDPYLPFWLNQIDSLKTIFSKKKPQAIFLPYETGPLALGFIAACKKHGIKTIGIQHGVIADNWKFYSFDPIASQENPYGFLLPDKIILFGNYSKQILLKNGYPEDKLVTFGNPVFFNLDKKIKIIADKEKNLKEFYGIKEEQIVILFTTISLQKFKSWSKENHNTQIWHHLLQNFGGNKKFYLILKPHPDENMSMYEEISKNYDTSNVKITKNSLYELAYLSTVVVSMFSTAIIDSLCYKKPVIQVMFDNVESPIPFDKFNVVLSSKLDDLTINIQKLLNDSTLSENLLKNSNYFLKELYNIPEQNPENNLLEIINSNIE